MAIYACTDLHSQYTLYEKIKAFLEPEDKVIFLGDAGDRGTDNSWKLIKTILSDPQFIYLKGNHEDMLYKAMYDYIKYEEIGSDYHLLCHNGGYYTFQGWLDEEERFYGDWMRLIKNLPCTYIYKNKTDKTIILSHAGYTPQYNYEQNTFTMPEDEHDILWSRDHFNDIWDRNLPTCVIVHGHTPKEYLEERLSPWNESELRPGAYWYCDNHKVCLDCGSAYTGETVLLNLDTFEEHIFTNESNEDIDF